jgi:L-threonylcarbamoyladenylate synthase
VSRPSRLVVDARRPDPAALQRAARVLKSGGLVALPTETFYGLGAHAFDPAAVGRIFELKGRPADKPLLVLVDSLAMAERVACEVSDRARRLAARYWPGPLTLVLPAHPAVPAGLTAGTGTIGVRLSGHPVARALVAALGGPVTAPSANSHGGPSPRTADEVIAAIGTGLDLVLDAGATPGGPASTVLDLTRAAPAVLRPGAVVLSEDDLRD